MAINLHSSSSLGWWGFYPSSNPMTPRIPVCSPLPSLFSRHRDRLDLIFHSIQRAKHQVCSPCHRPFASACIQITTFWECAVCHPVVVRNREIHGERLVHGSIPSIAVFMHKLHSRCIGSVAEVPLVWDYAPSDRMTLNRWTGTGEQRFSHFSLSAPQSATGGDPSIEYTSGCMSRLFYIPTWWVKRSRVSPMPFPSISSPA